MDMKVEINGIPFKDFTKEDQLSILNNLCGVASLHGLLTSTERRKAFERYKKKIKNL